MKSKNIYPLFDRMLTREDKEKLLKQKGCVFWFTGLSGSGKSTLALKLEQELYSRGFLTKLLDGDNIRTGLNNNLGFSEEDRMENIRRIAEVSKLFAETGIITLNCFVSPTVEMRSMAKDIIGDNFFHEIYINAPLEVCEQRDVKGLYEKARRGEIKDFTGIHQPFEPSVSPFLEIHTDKHTIDESVSLILEKILAIIQY